MVFTVYSAVQEKLTDMVESHATQIEDEKERIIQEKEAEERVCNFVYAVISPVILVRSTLKRYLPRRFMYCLSGAGLHKVVACHPLIILQDASI